MQNATFRNTCILPPEARFQKNAASKTEHTPYAFARLVHFQRIARHFAVCLVGGGGKGCCPLPPSRACAWAMKGSRSACLARAKTNTELIEALH